MEINSHQCYPSTWMVLSECLVDSTVVEYIYGCLHNRCPFISWSAALHGAIALWIFWCLFYSSASVCTFKIQCAIAEQKIDSWGVRQSISFTAELDCPWLKPWRAKCANVSTHFWWYTELMNNRLCRHQVRHVYPDSMLCFHVRFFRLLVESFELNNVPLGYQFSAPVFNT